MAFGKRILMLEPTKSGQLRHPFSELLLGVVQLDGCGSPGVEVTAIIGWVGIWPLRRDVELESHRSAIEGKITSGA